MAMSEKVEESLREAEASLRNALAFAARTEKAMVTSVISESISRIDTLIETHKLIDKLETRKPGDKGIWGMFHE
jgi:hypothetical protein